MFKKRIFSAVFSAVLILFTLYVMLDTFAIKRVYAAVDTPASSLSETIEEAALTDAQTEAAAEEADNADVGAADDGVSTVNTGAETPEEGNASVFTAETVVGENSYSDGNISITITEYREYDTAIYVAEVYIFSPEYLKTAFAESVYGRNITDKTSEMASGSGAILAVNGDYYGAQSKGYVIRNGVLYRESAISGREDLVIWADGSFSIITEGDVSAAALLENGAVQTLSFGPALIDDGEVAVTEGEEVGKAKTSNPRTAIGMIEPGHYLFVVSDGRTELSEGLSLYELAEFMESLGATVAYNLDGGGSSTMVFNGTVINNPTTSGESIRERSVSDIVYIG